MGTIVVVRICKRAIMLEVACRVLAVEVAAAAVPEVWKPPYEIIS